MGRLEALRAVAQRQLTANADLLYRHIGVWSDGVACPFSVSDPNKTAEGSKRAQALTGEQNVLDVRLLKVQPGVLPPGEGAFIPWDGGRLTLVSWTQVSDFTDTAIGVCRFTR